MIEKGNLMIPLFHVVKIPIDGNHCKMLMYPSEKADIIERNKYVEESKC